MIKAHNRIEYTRGDLIGNAEYIREAAPYIIPSLNKKVRMALFKCLFCGNEFKAKICMVKNGHTKSCGCFRKKVKGYIHRTHGMADTGDYKRWRGIKTRCYNESAINYHQYGGRGVKMYEAWVNDFKSFYDYISLLPNYGADGYSIDRIDNNGNYEPGNLRWADCHTQAANTLKRKNSTGYTGVIKHGKKYHSNITVRRKPVYLGTHETILGAANARNDYIIKNGLWEYPVQQTVLA